MTMDATNLMEKLDSTLRCVLSGRLTGEVDDTLLQKLLSKLQTGLSSQDSSSQFCSALGCSAVLSYVMSALQQEDRTSPALSFALQLLSVIIKENAFDICDGKHEDILKCLVQVLEPNVEDRSSVSSSVRVSCLLCLTALTENSVGYAWVLDNKLVDVGWRNLSESSIFVQRSSENFLSAVLTKDLMSGNDSMMKNILDTLGTADLCIQSGKRRTFDGCVRFLSQALSLVPQQLLQELREPLGQTILRTFQSYSGEDQTADGLNKMAVLFSENSSCRSILQHLSGQGRFVSAMKFSSNYLLYKTCKEPDVNQILQEILSGPLCLLTGRLDSDTGGEEGKLFIRALPDLLAQRTTCYKILSNSLTQLANVFVCSPQEFLHEILRMSVELIAARSSKDGESQGAATTVQVPCNRSLVALLQFQKDLLTYGVTLSIEEANQILASHVSLLQDMSLPSATFQASCKVLQLLSAHLCPCRASETLHGPCGWESVAAASLGSCLNRRLVDRHWEIVDSIVELCMHFFSSGYVCQGLRDWLLFHCLHVLLWDMLANLESEGYVRAACIRAVVAVICDDLCWQRLKTERELTSELVEEKICCLLTLDPEAFVQREAAGGLLRLVQSGFFSLQSELICRTLSLAVASCLDWEVKVSAVRCWQGALDTALQLCHNLDSLKETLSELFNRGCLSALACALRDCDRPVRHLAAQVLQKMKERVRNMECAEPFRNLLNDFHVDQRSADVVNRAPEGTSNNAHVETDERERVVNMVVDIDMRDRISAVIVPTTNTNIDVAKLSQSDYRCWQEVATFIWQCDLDSVIRDSDSSTDVYEDNLSALLDDILAAAEGESDDEEYQAIDCY